MTESVRYGVVNHPYLKTLSARERLKQIRRWRYVRHYQRKRLGDRWAIYWLIDQGLL